MEKLIKNLSGVSNETLRSSQSLSLKLGDTDILEAIEDAPSYNYESVTTYGSTTVVHLKVQKDWVIAEYRDDFNRIKPEWDNTYYTPVYQGVGTCHMADLPLAVRLWVIAHPDATLFVKEAEE